MPTTLPGDVEEQETSAGALAEQDQTDAAFRDITENYDKTSSTSGSAKLAGKVAGKKSSLKKKLLIGGGLSGGVVTLGIILFFLLLFKNLHIKRLFLDYEFAQFNRGFKNRLEKSITEADQTAAGTADSTVQTGASPDVALTEVDAAKLTELKTDLTKDPQAFNDAATQVETLDQSASIAGTTASEVNPVDSITTTIPSVDGETDAKAVEDTNANIKTEVSAGEDAHSPPNQAVQDAVTKADAEIKAGTVTGDTMETSVADAFNTGLRGAVSKATGPFIWATFMCIARDIFALPGHVLQKANFKASARQAAYLAKTSDCQNLGKCTMSQIGAVAGKYDGTVDGQTMSITQTCAAVRASGKVAIPIVAGKPETGNCTDLDENLRADTQPNGVAGTLVAVSRTLDGHFDLPKLCAGPVCTPSSIGVPIGTLCGFILNPATQVVAAGINIVTAVVAVISTPADFGAADVLEAAGQSAAAIFATKAGKALALDAALHYGGNLYKQNFNPLQMGNFTGEGFKALATQHCAANGCRVLTPPEHAKLALDIHADQVKEQRARGLAYQLFSPDNPISTLGLLTEKVPSTPRAALAVTTQFFATALNPTHLGKSLLAFINPVQPAWAADVTPNTFGIPDMGFTDDELNQWGVKDNSKWVNNPININDKQKKDFDKCFDPAQTEPLDLVYGDGKTGGTCIGYNDPNNANYAAFQHYRIYKLDQRVTQDLVLLYNNQGGQNPGAGASSTDGCVNPLADPRWGLSRTDEGVDYNTPSGVSLPVYAICDGTITNTNGNVGAHPWPGGAYINYKLTSGPFVGKCIYMAEHITDMPPVGTNVKAGQQIGTALGGNEWGWSQGGTTPASTGAEGVATEGGKAFARFLISLGGPNIVRDPPGPGPLYAGTPCP